MGQPLADFLTFAAGAVSTVSSTGGSSTPVLDMDGYEGVLFVGILDTTNAANQLTVRGGTASGALSEFTGPAGGEASGIGNRLYVDLYQPKMRYVDAVLSASGAAANRGIFAFQYGGRNLPATNSTVVNGRTLRTPNTGTATTSG